jgi:hypothetical protein
MSGRKIDVRKLIQIHHLTDGPCKGWVHTHGLAKLGRPELEIRNVPALFVSSACRILNMVAEYMLEHHDKPVLPGHTMELDRATLLLFHQGTAADEAGYDSSHYRVPVLRITALEQLCERCKPRAAA